MEVNIRDIYNVDTISQDSSWKRILEYINSSTEDIILNMDSVKLYEPWLFNSFKEILRIDRVKFIINDDEDIVTGIKIALLLENQSSERAEYRKTVVKEVVKTKEEKTIEKYGEPLIDYFNIEDGKMVFNVLDRFSAMQNDNTPKYIEYAIKRVHEKTGYTDFIINFDDMDILDNIIIYVAYLVVNLSELGIKVEFRSSILETCKLYMLYMHNIKAKRYSYYDRLKYIKDNLKPNTVGILVKYKKSRAVDDFGREGRGEIISSRIAVYKGIQRTKDGLYKVVIDTYNNNKFYTRTHWELLNDNESLSELEKDTVSIYMEQLGVMNEFLGSKYHFMLPNQKSKKENVEVIIDIDDNGNNIKKVCTIPERIKVVFDDWGIKYNKDELEKAIENTRKNLEKSNE